MRAIHRRARGACSILVIAEPLEGRILLSGLTGTGTSLQSVAGQTIDVGDIDGSGSVYVAPGVSVSVDSINEYALIDGGNLTISTPGLVNQSRNNFLVQLNLSPQAGVTGTLDLADNVLFLDYGTGSDPIAAVQESLQSGYNNGTWNGPGIISSTAAGTNQIYALGYADGADGVVAGLPDGIIEVKYTLSGDADLNGIVNGIDEGILNTDYYDNGRWTAGDFDYNGFINSNDFGDLAVNYNHGSSVLPAATYVDPAQYAATFTDDPNTPLDDLSAQVDWGDGSNPAAGAIVSDGNGTFHIIANHTYADAGDYDVTTTITDSNSNTSTDVASNAIVSTTPFSAFPLDDARIELAWMAEPVLGVGAVLQYSTDSTFATGVVSTTLASGVTDDIISGLSPATNYYFRLSPNTPGSPIFATASATTEPSDGNGGTDGPAAPTITQQAQSSQPSNTTLELTMTATGPDGDPISYDWEEVSGPSGPAPQFTNSEQTTDVILGAAGDYDFRCTATDDATGMSVSSDTHWTVNPVGTSITVSPDAAAVPVNGVNSGIEQLTAVENDQFNHSLETQPSFSWSVAKPLLGTVDPSGQFTADFRTNRLAAYAGTTQVYATADGLSGSALISVDGEAGHGDRDVVFNSTISSFPNVPGISFVGANGSSLEQVTTIRYSISKAIVNSDTQDAQGITVEFADPIDFTSLSLINLAWTSSALAVPDPGTGKVGSVDWTSGTSSGTMGLYVESDGDVWATTDNYLPSGVTSVQINLDADPRTGTTYTFGLAGGWVVPGPLDLTLGDGSSNQVLQGSDTGTLNLVPLYLNAPYNSIYDSIYTGTQVTLSTNAADKVDVWNSANPSQTDNPLLGGTGQTSQHSWTFGTDQIPSTLYVGATKGSTNVGDITFTLTVIPPGANSGVTATTQPATAVKVDINLLQNPNDPNNDPTTDISDQNEDWLIGQEAQLSAHVEAPAGLITDLSYNWSLPGNVLQSYAISNNGASQSQTPVPQSGIYDIEGDRSGTQEQLVQFFWLTPPNGSGNGALIGITVSGKIGDVDYDFSSSTTFDVYSPTVQVGEVQPGTPPYVNPFTFQVQASGSRDAIRVPVQVSLQGQFTGEAIPGYWTYLQTITYLNDSITEGVATYLDPQDGDNLKMLDTIFPVYNGSIVGQDDQPVQNVELPFGDTTFTFRDNPNNHLLNYGVITPKGKQIIIDPDLIWTRDNFATYVMFQPPGSDSYLVPVAMVTWSVRFDARYIPKDTVNPAQWIAEPEDLSGVFNIQEKTPAEEPVWKTVYDGAKSYVPQ